MKKTLAFITLIFISTSSTYINSTDTLTEETKPIIDRLQPIPLDSGFQQDGYFVWCGTMIRVGDRYHLFASRWPEGTGNPDDLVGILDGYRKYSEIVRATSDNPMGPF